MDKLLNKRKASGFTIIEVMIVLAIAGLIMVIVFIAVPQLQRNQRDNARQNIANRIKAEMETYAGNNQGLYSFGNATNAQGVACGATITGCWQDFLSRYVSGGKVNVKDPTSGADVVANTGATTGVPQLCNNATCSTVTLPASSGQFIVAYAAKCSGESLAQSGTPGATPLNVRTYAIMIGLDRAGTTYCVDNG
jgi:prepilin-type N-terminal cleavage/methylation domain-containing protein